MTNCLVMSLIDLEEGLDVTSKADLNPNLMIPGIILYCAPNELLERMHGESMLIHLNSKTC